MAADGAKERAEGLPESGACLWRASFCLNLQPQMGSQGIFLVYGETEALIVGTPIITVL